jgi:hypothetical protein
MSGVFAHLDDDIRSLAQSTEVCRLWWQEGHQRVWRNVQLRDLYDCVNDVSRRQYFASLVETIVFRPGDTILAEQRLSHQLLAFSRLSSVEMIVPSLRSWSVEYGDVQRKGDRETDDIAAMSALLTGCATLSFLNIQFDCKPSLGPVVYEMLDAITDVEHIHLQFIGEILYDIYPSEDLLQRLLCNKPKLATLSFTHGLEFFEEDIDLFLARNGSDWLVPSLRSFGRPVFNTAPAAVKLIERMPNLQQLVLTVMNDTGNWGNDLEHLFTFISTLPHLEHLELEISGENCDLDGSWLAQLGNLEQLEFLWLRYYNPSVISVTGAQLACLLTGLPKLRYLSLDLGAVEVSCTAEEITSIQNAMAKIEEVRLCGLTFVTELPL